MQPRWKGWLKILLVIVVVLVVALVVGPAVIGFVGGLAASAIGAGTAASAIGMIVGGAIVGAGAGAVTQMGNNVIDGAPILHDVAHAAINGAITGAIGGAAGAWGGAFTQAGSAFTGVAVRVGGNALGAFAGQVGADVLTGQQVNWSQAGMSALMAGGMTAGFEGFGALAQGGANGRFGAAGRWANRAANVMQSSEEAGRAAGGNLGNRMGRNEWTPGQAWPTNSIAQNIRGNSRSEEVPAGSEGPGATSTGTRTEPTEPTADAPTSSPTQQTTAPSEEALPVSSSPTEEPAAASPQLAEKAAPSGTQPREEPAATGKPATEEPTATGKPATDEPAAAEPTQAKPEETPNQEQPNQGPAKEAQRAAARERLAASRKAQAEARARAEAERLANRTPEQELAGTEYRSNAAQQSKSAGNRFGVDQPTIDNARAEYQSTYEQKYLDARRAGVPEDQATAQARAAAQERMNDIIQTKAAADAPQRALGDAQANMQGRGVPDAFKANDPMQPQNFRDVTPDASGNSVRGQIAREISPELAGKSVPEMEAIAQARGGVRNPPTGVDEVRTGALNEDKTPRLNPDGTPESYAQIEYNFPDGTRVRMKPNGDIINSSNPMYSVELTHADAPRPGMPQESIAFKYDAQGRPVPKGPSDIQNPYPEGTAAHQAYQDALIKAGHLHARPTTPTTGTTPSTPPSTMPPSSSGN